MRRRLSYRSADVAALFRERTGRVARSVKAYRGVGRGSAVSVWGVRSEERLYFVVIGRAVEIFSGGDPGQRWSAAQPAAEAYRRYLELHPEEVGGSS